MSPSFYSLILCSVFKKNKEFISYDLQFQKPNAKKKKLVKISTLLEITPILFGPQASARIFEDKWYSLLENLPFICFEGGSVDTAVSG